jgi:adenylate cyclase, class 2
MSKPLLEVEVKFYLTDLPSYENRVRSIGASLVRPRTRETNYRFDTADLNLTRSRQVLRLRQDDAAILTYKGPGVKNETVSIRPEIELAVNDFQSAQDFLVALGYQLVVKYEKWRTVYQLGELEITLDEMPFGNFTEIEGGGPALIQKTAAMLALNWNTRITKSYLQLFDHLKTKRNLNTNDLTFDAFRDIESKPDDLGVKPADLPVYL